MSTTTVDSLSVRDAGLAVTGLLVGSAAAVVTDVPPAAVFAVVFAGLVAERVLRE